MEFFWEDFNVIYQMTLGTPRTSTSTHHFKKNSFGHFNYTFKEYKIAEICFQLVIVVYDDLMFTSAQVVFFLTQIMFHFEDIS